MEMEPFEWGKLPLELREMCVRKLDFATSMKLRRASRFDKWMVEASHNRPKFDRLCLSEAVEGKSRVLLFVGEKTFDDEAKVESLIMCLLKYSHIRQLELSEFEKDATEFFDKIAAVGAVIPELWVDYLSDANFHLAMENFGEGVEMFDLGYGSTPSNKSLDRVLRDPLIIPRFLNAKHIQMWISTSSPTDRILQPTVFLTLIGLWIQNDKELGSKLIVEIASFNEDNNDHDPGKRGPPMFAAFLEKFPDRIVYENKEENVIRLATNNTENQILMRIIVDENTDQDFVDGMLKAAIVFQVIPATLEEEGYEKTAGRHDRQPRDLMYIDFYPDSFI